MALVTLEYYQDTFLGEPVTADEFPRYELRAEELILSLIRMNETKAAALPEDTLTAVQKAICAQVDALAINGLDSIAVQGSAGGGFTVGKVTVQAKAQAEAKAGTLSAAISPMAASYLEQTGLMGPQVDTLPEPFITDGWW